MTKRENRALRDEVERLRIIAADYQAMLHRANAMRAALNACVLGSKNWMEQAKAALKGGVER